MRAVPEPLRQVRPQGCLLAVQSGSSAVDVIAEESSVRSSCSFVVVERVHRCEARCESERVSNVAAPASLISATPTLTIVPERQGKGKGVEEHGLIFENRILLAHG